VAEHLGPGEVRDFLLQGTRTGKLGVAMKDGQPHVMPIWFVLDGEDIVFTTQAGTVKGRWIRADGRLSLCVDEEVPPYAFVHVRGRAIVSDDLDEMLHWATLIGARYMGEERAEEFGRRNAVEGELLVRLRPERIIGVTGVAD
jgi:PPOX class probable F420-dependent enzyme